MSTNGPHTHQTKEDDTYFVHCEQPDGSGALSAPSSKLIISSSYLLIDKNNKRYLMAVDHKYKPPLIRFPTIRHDATTDLRTSWKDTYLQVYIGAGKAWNLHNADEDVEEVVHYFAMNAPFYPSYCELATFWHPRRREWRLKDPGRTFPTLKGYEGCEVFWVSTNEGEELGYNADQAAVKECQDRLMQDQVAKFLAHLNDVVGR